MRARVSGTLLLQQTSFFLLVGVVVVGGACVPLVNFVQLLLVQRESVQAKAD